MTFLPLLVILAALMDRVRGDAFHFISRTVDKLIYGWVLAALFMHPFDILTLPIILGFALGMSAGWGDSSGAIIDRREMKPEEMNSWQVGPLKKSKWLSGIARGLMWGLPVSMLAFFDITLIAAAPIFAIAYVSAAWLAGTTFFKGSWDIMEVLRGFIAGALIAMLSLL